MSIAKKTCYLFILIHGTFFAVASVAQTCNPNIPLKTPTSEFTDHGDGTLTHQRTGLMWKKCIEGLSGSGCDQGSASAMNWSGALTHAASHEFAGHMVWRLPNIKELASIAETACYAPAMNLSVFPNEPGSLVWSSSPNANYSDSAWVLDFDDGYDGTHTKNGLKYVRLVRGGQ